MPEIGLKAVEHLLGMFTAARLRLGRASLRCEECGANPRLVRSAATGDPVTHERRDRPAQGYEISIRGHLGETVMQAFPGLQVERRGKTRSW
jgi:hypothetical protein